MQQLTSAEWSAGADELLNAVMWRWIAAVLRPDLFGIKESLVAPGIFLVAGISTFALMIYAWVEYVRDGRR